MLTVVRKQHIIKGLYDRQRRLCWYCARETFLGLHTDESVEEICKRLGLPWKHPRWKKMVRHRRATIEHLQRIVDGGTDGRSNLVMACNECNSTRSDRRPEAHRRLMRARYQPNGEKHGLQD